MKRISLILLTAFLIRLQAQLPDLDEFGGELILDLPAETEPDGLSEDGLPPNHLFAGWDHLKDLASWNRPLPAEKVVHLVLPQGMYLVAPNSSGLQDGYSRMARTVEEANLSSGSLVKVVLHADGNFSAALLLKEPPTQPIPPGLDISPVPETHLAGMITDVQELDRSSPLILQAFVALQKTAAEKGWKLDRREFFFLPIEPGKVFFGLEFNHPPQRDKSRKHE